MSRNLFSNILINFKDVSHPIAIGLSGLFLGAHACYTYGTTDTRQIIVKEKYTFTRFGFTEFMIIDRNDQHYNVANSFWHWKWDSIEDWSNIQEKNVLSITYYGGRIPIFGLFPNIIDYNHSLKRLVYTWGKYYG
jgi:hypothetical protein